MGSLLILLLLGRSTGRPGGSTRDAQKRDEVGLLVKNPGAAVAAVENVVTCSDDEPASRPRHVPAPHRRAGRAPRNQ